MLFNSFEFIFLFLPVSAIGFHLLQLWRQNVLARDWLIACSLLFYSWGNPRNLPVLLVSIGFNYAVTRRMGDLTSNSSLGDQRRKNFLVAGVVSNILFLSYFKYLSHLPLGISFFTLMQIMYLVDCYEGVLRPNTLREHALLVSFFPTVSMGPILRPKDMMPQLRNSHAVGVTTDLLAGAILLFSMGLFKKVVIAESFARIADAGYSSPLTLSMVEGWATSVSYSLQLYYDFSGYSDMAVAVALFLGLRIPINFNSPYQARSIVDFWRRWHISLSNFITTYVYTPIVRSFKQLTFEKAMWATFMSMMIIGIWHGSKWNFAIFGALHGIGLVVNHCWKKAKAKLPDGAAWVLTFAYVNLTFIFFRASTLSDAIVVVRSLFDVKTSMMSTTTFQLAISSSDMKELILPILLGTAMVFLKKNSNQIVKDFRPTWQNLSLGIFAMLVSLIYLNSSTAKEFIYRDF